MGKNADPHAPQDPGEPFLSGRLPPAVQHIGTVIAESRQCSLPWYPVVAEVVRNFVGKREPLLVVRIGSIQEDKALSGTCHEARTQWPMAEIGVYINSPIPKPVSQVRKAKAWQLDDSER